MKNYEKGGDTIVECMSDAEIDQEFKSLADAKKHCKLLHEHAEEIRSTAW